MLKIPVILTCAALVGWADTTVAATTAPMPASSTSLWYDRPAKDWRTEALPIGNGRIGAMMFGGVAQERIQFNEQTLWIGQGGWFEWPNIKPFGCYQNFGDVEIRFKNHFQVAEIALTGISLGQEGATDYRRELDIGTGIHRVTFTQDGVRITREAFASQPQQVLVFRYTADKPGAFSGQVALKLAQKAQSTSGAGSLAAAGVLVNGMKFACKLQVLHQGGTLLAKDGVLTFDRCDRLTLLLDARTDYAPDYHANWKGAAPELVLDKELASAAAKSYAELRSAHLAEFTPVMKRVTLDLGATTVPVKALTADKRLTAYAKGGADPELEALMFQYGRYILFSSSRPDSILPANLQGIWNDSHDPRQRSRRQMRTPPRVGPQGFNAQTAGIPNLGFLT